MTIFETSDEGYLIHENKGEFTVCKIIETFNDEDEALAKLLELLSENP